MVARTIVVQGNLPALLKDPFFFKTLGVQKRREGAGAPVGFVGGTGSEKKNSTSREFVKVNLSAPPKDYPRVTRIVRYKHLN